MLGKPKRGLRILKIRVRELFTHREGISTLCDENPETGQIQAKGPSGEG